MPGPVRRRGTRRPRSRLRPRLRPGSHPRPRQRPRPRPGSRPGQNASGSSAVRLRYGISCSASSSRDDASRPATPVR
ncbi:hypothetical protein C6Y14_22510 [Streptomyces dioscori]|uniref:Uncharacterized protein n=1 Tax=Streptomyces dioscori TaxID=2109333 RepID=A0A2P8Q4J7_9ACTN|nr:hypothetical protein C6Y14_22510 [Streptomyces dioscori]